MCMSLDQQLPAITVIVEMEKVGSTGERALFNADLDTNGNRVETNNKILKKRFALVNSYGQLRNATSERSFPCKGGKK